METRVNYAAVGLFVVILSVALIATGLWFSADLTGRDYQRYSIYSTEAVTGLTISAPVRYRGVDVGRVSQIALDRERPERVHLVVEIDADTPLRRDTRARLSVQGLTGIAHVELTGGSTDAPPPERPQGEPYPVIATAPSLLSRLDTALDAGMASLDRISVQIETLLQDGNLESLAATLTNMEQLTRSLSGHSARLDGILGQAETFMEDGSRLSGELTQRLPELFNSMNAALQGVDGMSRSLARNGDQIGAASRQSAESLAGITTTTLPQLGSLLRELESLAFSLGSLTDELSENPSLILYGRPARAPGPGEQ